MFWKKEKPWQLCSHIFNASVEYIHNVDMDSWSTQDILTNRLFTTRMENSENWLKFARGWGDLKLQARFMGAALLWYNDSGKELSFTATEKCFSDLSYTFGTTGQKQLWDARIKNLCLFHLCCQVKSRIALSFFCVVYQLVQSCCREEKHFTSTSFKRDTNSVVFRFSGS